MRAWSVSVIIGLLLALVIAVAGINVKFGDLVALRTAGVQDLRSQVAASRLDLTNSMVKVVQACLLYDRTITAMQVSLRAQGEAISLQSEKLEALGSEALSRRKWSKLKAKFETRPPEAETKEKEED